MTLHLRDGAVLQAGVVAQAAGSAYGEFGDTKVIAAVYGPKQGPRGFNEEGVLECEVTRARFRGRGDADLEAPGAKDASRDAREAESDLVCRALAPALMLDQFPKAVVQVFVMVLDSGGADVAPAVVCAALALADAGLPMRDLVSACTLSRREGSLLLDPVEEEIADEDGSLLVACMPNAGKVTQLLSSGDWHVSKYRQALGLAVDGCAKYLPLMNTALADGYQKRKDQLAA